jgi:hypothetical protein
MNNILLREGDCRYRRSPGRLSLVSIVDTDDIQKTRVRADTRRPPDLPVAEPLQSMGIRLMPVLMRGEEHYY